MARIRVKSGHSIKAIGFITHGQVVCKSCGASKIVSSEQRGRTLCPRCRKVIRIG